MVLIRNGEIYIKILYFGIYASGKTTILDTLFRLSKQKVKEIVPVGNLTKIGRSSGSTLYFDKGLFQSKKQNKVFYMVYTVAGQKSFSSLREKIFEGSDGIIFVWDSQKHLFEDNIEFIKELKSLAKDRLIKEIPLIVMLNKSDLDNTISKEEVRKILHAEKLWFNSGNILSRWNPEIFKTCALYDKKRNIYESFQECSRRTVLYQIFGDGKAPEGNFEVKKERLKFI